MCSGSSAVGTMARAQAALAPARRARARRGPSRARAFRLAWLLPLAAACDRDAEATPVRQLVPAATLAGYADELGAFNAGGGERAESRAGTLRACGDPNNLPYSNARLEGFENELVALVADELGLDTAWTWFPQRRGFARMTLRAGECDVIAGVPSSYEQALTTAPYYRSTYVFVTRADRQLDIASLDDPRLRTLRVGVHTVGDDYANTPGAEALARRGLAGNVVGYSIYGDYTRESPPGALIDAVADGEVDVAIAWGPIAGWFARRASAPLRLEPVTPQIDPPFTPFVYDVSMAVRRGEDSLKLELEDALRRRAPEIRALLGRYAVPVVQTGRPGLREPS